MSNIDYGLDTLLSLHGETFPMDNGFWTKFEAYKVEVSIQIPHGIKYSLTLHNQSNVRIFGIDNAHGFKPKKKKFGAKIVTWDHKHKQNKVVNYEFENAGQLLKDFWDGVNQTIIEVTS
ncbi:DUF6516 family protein [Paraglaciecola chathamensis]|uniref:toxin-antitoxin system TumE family protein n=1 Tax=Paraglaciecola chathamensis TaxID=368405 RepID=UPI002707F5A4|nr:DUF6516 family protein [Paraglaciecola chathamensis]MDO6842153.1 DUF6516 family protein [Paraglaciecola chathamensis]